MAIPSYRISFDGAPAADDLYEHLIRLEIEEDFRKAASFVFRLSLALQPDGSWSYLEDERFDLFKKVSIAMGMGSGDATPVLEGYITHLAPHFDPQEELCYLEVRGMDPTCLMNLEEKTITWAAQTHSAIAAAIFDSYGINPVIEDTPTIHEGVVQRGTDIRFLKDLASRNGYDCYVAVDDSGTVNGHFKPFELDASPLPPLAVHFEGETNVQFFDIQVAATQPMGTAGWHLSLEDRSLEQVEKTEYRNAKLGRQTLPEIARSRVESLCSPAEGASRALQNHFTTLDAVDLENTLQSSFDHHGWFIKAKGIVNGEDYGELIRARRVIPVKGIGIRYGGNYFVTFVKHVLTEGQYAQHIELMRNAWGVTGDEAFEAES